MSFSARSTERFASPVTIFNVDSRKAGAFAPAFFFSSPPAHPPAAFEGPLADHLHQISALPVLPELLLCANALLSASSTEKRVKTVSCEAAFGLDAAEKAVFPLGNASFPSGNASLPARNVTFHSGNGSLPRGNASLPEGNEAFPASNAVLPAGNATFHSGNAPLPEGNDPLPTRNASLPARNEAFLAASAALSARKGRPREAGSVLYLGIAGRACRAGLTGDKKASHPCWQEKEEDQAASHTRTERLMKSDFALSQFPVKGKREERSRMKRLIRAGQRGRSCARPAWPRKGLDPPRPAARRSRRHLLPAD